jgi:hypothetical protein
MNSKDVLLVTGVLVAGLVCLVVFFAILHMMAVI